MNVIAQTHRPDWTLYNADCVEVVRALPDCSVDFTVYSPPFSSLYVFSPSERDMANVVNDAEFMQFYGYLAAELYRVTKPGRLVAVHCKEITDYKSQTGRTGIRDFPGDLVRAHEQAGWKFHSRATIWKCPVNEMTRTHSQKLLFGQMKKDSTLSGVAQPDYILVFRRWPEDGETTVPVAHDESEIPLATWKEWASPVWMNINQTNTLNTAEAKAEGDERHMTPLQLDVIERLIRLYSNPGDVVLSPFAGIGSEGFVAVQHRRKFIGVELKPEYYAKAVENIDAATMQLGLGL
jgi:DNA modification methylase